MNLASKDDILACQFHQWYLKFEKYTMKSQIINLNSDFIQYLGEDNLVLPSSTDKYFAGDQLSDSDDEKVVELEDGEDLSDRSAPDFSELELEITNALKRLKGEVFIKLNWSAPTDASWMNGGSLKCRNIAEIYLLLKSSDRITFDIEKMFAQCTDSDPIPAIDYKLILRKWANLNPAMEFRSFVHNGILKGISQRECSTYFKFLAAESETLCDLIEAFYNNVMKENCTLNSYCFDVYVDREQRVWLVDINPFGEPTEACLFEWSEFETGTIDTNNEVVDIESIRIINSIQVDESVKTVFDISASSEEVAKVRKSTQEQSKYNESYQLELRLIESEDEVHPNPAGAYRGPVDVHLSHEFPNFMELCKADGQHDVKRGGRYEDENDN